MRKKEQPRDRVLEACCEEQAEKLARHEARATEEKEPGRREFSGRTGKRDRERDQGRDGLESKAGIKDKEVRCGR